MKTNNLFKSLLWIGLILATLSNLSCNNYQDPGNNTGKTGDGTQHGGLSPKADSANKRLNVDNPQKPIVSDTTHKK